ncbi:hypothetical protein TNCV_1888851 [Trichonephila clavipes]|nr:hypothetical protein TNCV_1888851 [Trichonephila clavipes]
MPLPSVLGLLFGRDGILYRKAESLPDLDEIDNVIQEVDFVRQINLEVHIDDVQELLDSHNHELTMDWFIEMHEYQLKLSGATAHPSIRDHWALRRVPAQMSSSSFDHGSKLRVQESISNVEISTFSTQAEIPQILKGKDMLEVLFFDIQGIAHLEFIPERRSVSEELHSRHSETMARRKGLSPNEISNSMREISDNESDCDELFCSNLDSNEDIRLSESDCEESEKNPDI